MAPDPRHAAQARADRVRAFRREVSQLAAEDVLHLTDEQASAVAAHHDQLLTALARDFDVDRSDREGQLSRGLRIASVLGGAALIAAITALIQRVWGGLSLPAQVTLLTACPLVSLAGVQLAAERERTRYVAGLFALVACGTAWFAIGMIPRLLDLPMSALLLWPSAAFGVAVAVSYGFRLVLVLSLVLLVTASASVFFVAGGVPWPTLFERLEPLAGTSFVLLALSRHIGPLGEGFADAARNTAMALGLGALLVLSNASGTSLLAYAPETTRVLYQVAFVPVTVFLLWRALGAGDVTGTNLGALALGLFLIIRYVDWFWERLPAWAFFLVLAGVALVSIAALKRARGRAGAR